MKSKILCEGIQLTEDGAIHITETLLLECDTLYRVKSQDVNCGDYVFLRKKSPCEAEGEEKARYLSAAVYYLHP